MNKPVILTLTLSDIMIQIFIEAMAKEDGFCPTDLGIKENHYNIETCKRASCEDCWRQTLIKQQ